MKRDRRRPRFDDSGDTLIEVLVALAVLGIGITALMGGLSTDATTTIVNRDQSRVDSILNASAEYVKSLPYQACSGAATTITTQVPHDAAFTATYGPAVDFNGTVTCSTMQRVPVTVTGNGFTVTLDVVKRP